MRIIGVAALLVESLTLCSAFNVDRESSSLLARAIGSSCRAPLGRGSCQHTSNCRGISYVEPYCPYDPEDVQCCLEITCNADGGRGFCRSVSNNGCPGGTFHPGTGPNWPCPGDNDIQCCIQDAAPPPPPPSGGAGGAVDVGRQVLAKAMTAAGVPYAWGGGSCAGPTGDQPPYDYGDVGFDCSGLVSWAVCQVTGRDLFTEGLRVTRTMYCADESELGFKKYPYSERLPGDAVFFGGSCDCINNPSSIHHVGLLMESGDRIWNSPNDRVNQVQENKISDFEAPCPYVIRFS